MLQKCRKEFLEERSPAEKAELNQMHRRVCFNVIIVAELSQRERLQAREGLMILSQKLSSKITDRLMYNGKARREVGRRGVVQQRTRPFQLVGLARCGRVSHVHGGAAGRRHFTGDHGERAEDLSLCSISGLN